ncbi:hypothetical protein QUA56_29095 [Microcoleus sp. N3A4]|uniref:hypothetical protein n=1 Tax=Microcoleus sp. N3A4 TaxID=3055379 RepID=UPI002FD3DF22
MNPKTIKPLTLPSLPLVERSLFNKRKIDRASQKNPQATAEAAAIDLTNYSFQ